jgi:hypothetical protein
MHVLNVNVRSSVPAEAVLLIGCRAAELVRIRMRIAGRRRRATASGDQPVIESGEDLR